jgi:hypothetical protein
VLRICLIYLDESCYVVLKESGFMA